MFLNITVPCKGAFTPTRSGSARRCGERFPRRSSVYTSAGPRAISLLLEPHFAALDLWSMNTDQSMLPIPAGPAEELLCERSLWAPAVEAERARSGVNSTTQFLQTDPLRNPRAGSARVPRAFSALVWMPLNFAVFVWFSCINAC